MCKNVKQYKKHKKQQNINIQLNFYFKRHHFVKVAPGMMASDSQI